MGRIDTFWALFVKSRLMMAMMKTALNVEKRVEVDETKWMGDCGVVGGACETRARGIVRWEVQKGWWDWRAYSDNRILWLSNSVTVLPTPRFHWDCHSAYRVLWLFGHCAVVVNSSKSHKACNGKNKFDLWSPEFCIQGLWYFATFVRNGKVLQYLNQTQLCRRICWA